MRKFTLLVAFLAFTGLTFAQNCALTKAGSLEKAKANVQAPTKAAGDVIWSEDFDGAEWSSTVEVDDQGYLLDVTATLPDGWTIIDNNDLNYFWHWSDVGPRGVYTSSPDETAFTPNSDDVASFPDGTSTDNGFLMLEADYFNMTAEGEMVTSPVEMNASLQYGPLDFSDFPSVMFNSRNVFRYCCNSGSSLLNVDVSSNYNPADGSGDWTSIRINTLTPVNVHSSNTPSELDFHVNVSEYVGGKDAVYVRLSMVGASHYMWLVDDIAFYEGSVNDIILKDGFADYLYDATEENYGISSENSENFWGGYTEIPQVVVGNFVQFRSAVYANGSSDAVDTKLTAKIFKDGVLDETFTSTPQTVWSYSNDTLKVEVDYTPADVAHYQVSMTVDMAANDENPGDNGWGYEFDVTSGNRYSRIRKGMENDFTIASNRDWADGGLDGDVMAQRFTFPASIENFQVKSLSVYIDDYTNNAAEIAAIENGDFSIIARMFGENEDKTEMIDLGIASDLYTMVISDTATWLTLNFKDDANLSIPNSDGYIFWAAIEIYTGNVDLRFRIGEDNYVKQPDGGGYCYLIKNDSWANNGISNYAIDLNLDMAIDIPENGSVQYDLNNIKVYPNPFNSNLTVKNLGNATQMVVSNVLGQTVMTIPVTNNEMDINTDNLDKGVYLITVIDSNNNRTTKRVVKK